MSIRNIRVWSAVLAFVLLGAFDPASGATITEVATRDLAPASGVVVAVKGNEVIIDLDAADGLRPGDLVSVLGEGAKLIHPVTGKVIGTLEAPKAILSVSRVRDGFSHARRIGGAEGVVSRGDPVRRFEEIPVRFWDYTGEGEWLFRKLRNGLPTLKWGDYQTDQADRPVTPEALKGYEGLFMILKGNSLEIRGPEFRTLYAYRMASGDGETSPAVSTEAAVAPSTQTRPSGASVKPAPQSSAPPSPSPPRPVVSPEYGDMDRHGQIPGGTVAMADFLPYGDRLLMATGSGTTLRVFEVGEELRELASADAGVGNIIYAVRWWHPEGSDRPFVAATAYGDEEMNSGVYAFDGDGLRRVQGYIRAILGTLDRDGDGRPETLLRQSFDRDIFWGTRVQELTLAGDRLVEHPAPMPIPRKFTAIGGMTADLTGDGRLELVSVRGQTLMVFSGEDVIFETPGMGGSLSRLIYAVNPDQQDVLTSGETLEIDPVAVDLDGDGRLELIAPSAVRSTLTVAGIYSGFQSTQLGVFSYRDGNFIKGTLGDALNHPVQGLTVHDGRVYLVTSQPGNLLGEGGDSRLVSFRLAK